MEEAPGAIAYTFNASTPGVLTRDPTNPVAVNDVVVFDPISYPFAFSVAAYVDTNMALYIDIDDNFAICPAGLVIPFTANYRSN